MASRLRDLAKAALFSLAFLLLIEGAMQLANVNVPGSFTMPDARRGFRLRPNAHGWHLAEGRNYERINSLGYEDVERTLNRPPGTLRIAVIGASYVQSEQTSPQKSFPGVMERILKASPKIQARNVEVLNFGVIAYGMPEFWMTLHDDVWKYDPQIVIDALTPYNDIVDSDRYTTINGRRYPYFIPKDGTLVPDAITLASQKPIDPGWLAWINHWRDFENHFKLLLLMEQVIRKIDPNQNCQPGLRDDPMQVATFHPPRNPHLQNAWNVTETALKLMRDECAAHHAEFWLVTLDYPYQTEPDLRNRARVFQMFGLDDPHYADRRLAEFAQREGIHSYWLSPILADYAASHNIALHGFFNTRRNAGHYNETGNEVVGSFIADYLAANSPRLTAPVD